MGISWKDAAELVGIGAIVASLIFVGLELRQSQQIAIAGQYQDRTETYSIMMFERQALRPNSKSSARAVRSRFADVIPKSRFDQMTDEEIAIESVSANVNLALFDNNHFQYQAGLMSEESWQAQRHRLKGAMRRNEFMRAEVALRGNRYRDSFLSMVQDIVSEIEN